MRAKIFLFALVCVFAFGFFAQMQGKKYLQEYINIYASKYHLSLDSMDLISIKLSAQNFKLEINTLQTLKNLVLSNSFLAQFQEKLEISGKLILTNELINTILQKKEFNFSIKEIRGKRESSKDWLISAYSDKLSLQAKSKDFHTFKGKLHINNLSLNTMQNITLKDVNFDFIYKDNLLLSTQDFGGILEIHAQNTQLSFTLQNISLDSINHMLDAPLPLLGNISGKIIYSLMDDATNFDLTSRNLVLSKNQFVDDLDNITNLLLYKNVYTITQLKGTHFNKDARNIWRFSLKANTKNINLSTENALVQDGKIKANLLIALEKTNLTLALSGDTRKPKIALRNLQIDVNEVLDKLLKKYKF